MKYTPSEIEPKWQTYWAQKESYKTHNNSGKPKFYVLDMFPYPSGAGLHVGHPLGYIASDIFARFKRMQGFEVLHPMGFDAFGLPAEQYAIQTGIHPEDSTIDNANRYREQLKKIALSFDWSREVSTCDSAYYRWTQHLFLLLFNHYYDTKTDKSTPITELVAHLEKHGTTQLTAYTTTEHLDFSAAQWAGFSDFEKAEILMNFRLAYRKEGTVNWCEALGCVLANDEIKDGLSIRGGHPVTHKSMKQWALRVSAYTERLLADLETVQFSESIKTLQRNWIGKSTGALVRFPIAASQDHLEVFTTRPDTVFGVSFMVIAPEHGMRQNLTTPEQRAEVENYVAWVDTRSEIDRRAEKKISGVFTGSYVTHPFSGKNIPIWISEYVLIGYGTGAIMAVPSNDERDEKFAQKFGLEIIEVVDQSAFPKAEKEDKVGTIINSDFINGKSVVEAIDSVIERLESSGVGERKTNYKLRDANFSRQRYWGEPFPIKYSPEGIAEAIEELPVLLPKTDDFKPNSDGRSPLARLTDWVNLGEGYTRETDTMPGFAGSSWYFLRYMDPNNQNEPFSKEAIDYWQQVDLYVGGAEHAVGHLIYSRTWHKFLYDLGLVPTSEPYKKLVNQGMIQGVAEYLFKYKEQQNGQHVFLSTELAKAENQELLTKIPVHIEFVKNYQAAEGDAYLDAEGIAKFEAWMPAYAGSKYLTNPEGRCYTQNEVGKMSKSLYNVVNPDDIIAQYGTDCFRLYEMFLGPLEMAKPWNTNSIEGCLKFLRRVWSLFYDQEGKLLLNNDAAQPEELKALHTCIRKVAQDIENLSLNTAVSAMMICVNELQKLNCHKTVILTDLVKVLAPFAPHIAEELWQQVLGQTTSVTQASAPIFNESYLVENSFELPICINGKKRTELTFDAQATKEQIIEQALATEVVQRQLEGKTPKNVIYVSGRMLNIVL